MLSCICTNLCSPFYGVARNCINISVGVLSIMVAKPLTTVFFYSSFQSYRDLKEVTPEALQMVKRNFEWVAERVEVSVFMNNICRL